jgi:hypothetical protein
MPGNESQLAADLANAEARLALLEQRLLTLMVSLGAATQMLTMVNSAGNS